MENVKLKIFISPTCEYSRMVKDFIDVNKNQLTHLDIEYIDIDKAENTEIVQKYKVRNIPTIIGQHEQMIVGYLPTYLYSLLK